MRRARFLSLGLALGVGIFARFVALDEQPIWHDEAYTRVFATGHRVAEWGPALYRGELVTRDEVLAFQRLDPSRGVAATVRGLVEEEPQHPPAYYVAARSWMTVFGDGIASLRALSGVVGLVLVLAALWLGRELFRSLGDEAALLFASLVALSPFFVLFAREAREYTAFGALILASSAALLRALRLADEGAAGPARTRAFALYAALSALGLYTALSHAAVALAQALFVAWRFRGRPTPGSVGAALALAASGLAFLPWALALLAHLDSLSASLAWSRHIVVPRDELLRALLINLARPLLDLWPAPAGALPWLATSLVVALVLGSLVHLGRRGPPAGRALVLALFLLPLLSLLGPDLAFGGIRSLSTRYLFPALLAALIAVAHRLVTLPPRWRPGSIGVVLSLATASTLLTIRAPVPWSRALSAGLPAVAAAVDASARPLLIGDRERHHPGNLLALSALVGRDTSFLFLDHPDRAALIARARAHAGERVWPPAGLPADRTLFLYSPVPELREALEAATGAPLTPVYQDLHVQCWRLDPPARSGSGE